MARPEPDASAQGGDETDDIAAASRPPSRLRHAAGASLGIKLTATGLSFVTSLVLARTLGPDGFGIYAFAIAVITLLGVPAVLGLPQLVVRHVAAYRSRAAWGPLAGLLRLANQAAGAVSLVLAAAAFGATLAVWGDTRIEAIRTLWLALPLVPLLALAAIRVAALQGFDHVVLAQVPEGLLRPALFLVLIGVLAVAGAASPVTVMLMQLIATAAAFVAGTFFLSRHTPPEPRRVAPEYRTRQWLGSAWPLLVVGGMQVINTQADLLLLGALTSAPEVGVYRIASRGAELVLFMLTAINLVVAPTLSQLAATGDRSPLQWVLNMTAWVAFAFALPLTLVLVVFARPLLAFVFGADFAAGSVPLAILCMAQLVNAATGAVATLMVMAGREKDTAIAVGLGALLNVALNLALIPYWGMTGAALATAASVVVCNVWLALRAYRVLGVNATVFQRPVGWRTAVDRALRRS